MSKIKRISFKGYIGIEEFGLDAGKINIFKGPKGSCKSSIIEGIETTLTNSKRRTEVIKHGEDEAVLFVELDDGLEINRKIRDDKADYLKVRKGDEGVPNTEGFLRSFINGNIFRPLDWVNLSTKEQTKSILNMLQISWTNSDIENWFGEIPSNIEFNQHILMILKAIETKYFKDREETNRQIKELKTQIEVIKKDLPADYDGEEWRMKKIQEYYNKVSEAQKINQLIQQAKALQENFESKVAAINANAENDKSRVQMKFKDQRQDIKDIIDLSNSKIEKANTELSNADTELEKAIKEHEILYQLTLNELEKEFEMRKQDLKDKLQKRNEDGKAATVKAKEELKDLVSLQENKIVQKTEELNSIDGLEKQELKAVDEKIVSEIEKEKIRVGKAAEYIENHEAVDIEPLQKEADEVANMQSYLRDWDKIIDIRDNKLSDKERDAAILTGRIEKARTLPSELLKTAQMPIEGISVDEKGLIRINGTLIDGLSEGEQFELAMKIAKAQCGELKVICLDGIEKLKSEEKSILETALADEYQYFITEHTDDTEMKVEKLGGNN